MNMDLKHVLQGLGVGDGAAALRADPRGVQGEGGGGPGGSVLDPPGALAQVQVCRRRPEESAASPPVGERGQEEIQHRTQR